MRYEEAAKLRENYRKIMLKFWWQCEDCHDSLHWRLGWFEGSWYPSEKYERLPKNLFKPGQKFVPFDTTSSG